MPKLTEEDKQQRKDWRTSHAKYLSDHGKDKISRDNGFRSFVIFDDTRVSEGGWHSGKWMTAASMNRILKKWVTRSYNTRADKWLEQRKDADYDVLTGIDIVKARELDSAYDFTAGVAQCGGCQWFAAFDSDYGLCFNQDSENEGRVTFEHGGCIQHSSIQRLLKEGTS